MRREKWLELAILGQGIAGRNVIPDARNLDLFEVAIVA
jgi:hypothetical protein